MNWTIILSGLTAFIITAGGAVGIVAASGNTLNKTVWTLSAILGVVAVAKDIRSLLKLPPVDTAPPRITKIPCWLLIGLLSIAVPASFTGCAWFQPTTVAFGSDAIVVGAEQSAKLAVAYTGEFLKWEWTNRAFVTPEITKLADKVREEFPKDYKALREATKAFKLNRSPENKATLDTASAVLNALLNQVRLRLPAAQAKVAEKTAKTINLN